MKRLNINVSPLDRAFQQAPEVFKSVRMDMALGVANRMVNDLVNIILVHADIGTKRVGMQFRALQHIFPNIALNLVITRRLKHLQLDPRRFAACCALKKTLHSGLALPARNNVLLALVSEPISTADECLIRLNLTSHFRNGLVLNSEANALQHEPSSFLGDAKRATNLVGTNPVLRVHDQPESRKPLAEGKCAIFKNSSYLGRKLFSAAFALPAFLRSKESNFVGLAIGASHFAVLPAQRDHEIQGPNLISKVGNCLLKCLGKFNRFVLHATNLRHVLWLVKYIITINNDTKTISEINEVNFPKHLNKGVCEYLVVRGGYFDFKGRSGLIEIIKSYVPDGHYLHKAVSDHKYVAALDQLSALRNFAAHDSSKSRQAAYRATGNYKLSTAGSWLRSQGRFEKICEDLIDLAKEIEKGAPY